MFFFGHSYLLFFFQHCHIFKIQRNKMCTLTAATCSRVPVSSSHLWHWLIPPGPSWQWGEKSPACSNYCHRQIFSFFNRESRESSPTKTRQWIQHLPGGKGCNTSKRNELHRLDILTFFYSCCLWCLPLSCVWIPGIKETL